MGSQIDTTEATNNFPHIQVPEWTKCSNREKRKEKEKPFYSDSEGESGPTESADSGEEMVRAGACVCILWLPVWCKRVLLCYMVMGPREHAPVCVFMHRRD